jgi:hypothetical protein
VRKSDISEIVLTHTNGAEVNSETGPNHIYLASPRRTLMEDPFGLMRSCVYLRPGAGEVPSGMMLYPQVPEEYGHPDSYGIPVMGLG